MKNFFTKLTTTLGACSMLVFAGCNDDSFSNPFEDPNAIELDLIAENMTSPVYLTQPPADDQRLFVVDQIGLIRIIKDGSLMEAPFLVIKSKIVSPLKEEYEERGLLGLAFHPDYAHNGRFFVYYSGPLRSSAPNDYDHTNYVAEYQGSASNPDMAEPGSEKIILAMDQPYYNHNAGTLMFGPDRNLYISIGDGGNNNDIGTGHVADWYKENEGGNGQDVEKNLLGSILRIDVNSGSPYGIPADNPFVEGPGMDEIFAYGFRNPYRFTFDSKTGMIIAGDAGQALYEEVDVVVKGGNYGWNVKEGRHYFNAADELNPLSSCPTVDDMGHPLIDPVIEFKNSANAPDGLGLVVVGGKVYRSNKVTKLNGKYLFGVWAQKDDKASGAIFAADVANGSSNWIFDKLTIQNQPNKELGYFLLGFGEDNKGEVYVLTIDEEGPHGNTGKVFKINKGL